MTEFVAKGYGMTLRIADGVLTFEAGLANRGFIGGKRLDLGAADITGIYFKPAKVLTNGQFILGTEKGQVTVIFTRKHADEFEQAASIVRAMGIRDDDSVRKLPFYSAKAVGSSVLPDQQYDSESHELLDAAERFKAWRADSKATDEANRAASRKVRSTRKANPNRTPEVTKSGSQEFVLDEEVFGGVIEVIGNRGTHPNVVPRDDSYADLDVVGESNYQEALSKVANHQAGDQAGWQYGFLAPEQDNPYDSNAVAVYIITRVKGEPLDAEKVGYLPRGKAAELSAKLVRQLVTRGRIVPLLLRLTGGSEDRPSYGVIAKAYCDLVAD